MAAIKEKQQREPLVHIVKRDALPQGKSVMIRAIALVAGFIVCGIVAMLLAGANPIKIYASMFSGVFKTPTRFLNLLKEMSFLLCISLAVTPAFKMRFWNCGAEGQVLVGGLACVACRIYFGDTLSLPVLLVVMVLASILASVVWSVLPAIFKAIWNTNETLFTLMMNYVAMQLVSFFLKVWVDSGSGTLSTKEAWSFPSIFGNGYIYNILLVGVVTAIVYVYLKYSKQGYEISVVGESENTAKYVGINVKKVIIRTLVVSGVLCGIAGLLLVHNSSLTITKDIVEGRGFTAIMVSWLAKFNPIYMVMTTFLVVFLQRGSNQITYDYNIDSAVSDIITAIILFFIIGCEFFINYKIIFRKRTERGANK